MKKLWIVSLALLFCMPLSVAAAESAPASSTSDTGTDTTTSEPEVPETPKKTQTDVYYKAYVQKEGWQKEQKNGQTSGTTGKKRRIEAIQIRLDLETDLTGQIEYQTFTTGLGWSKWRKNGTTSGTTGKSKPIEAIKIRLTGNIAKKYDIYYQANAAQFGWLGWAKNGAAAGTQGYNFAAEGIKIKLSKKNKPIKAGGKAFERLISTSTKTKYYTITAKNADFYQLPAARAKKISSAKRYKGYVLKASKEVKTTSGTFLYVSDAGKSYGWIAKSATKECGDFWRYNTGGPHPSLKVKNLNIAVSISKQRVYIRSGKRVLYTMLCSTGLPSTPTPLGTYHITGVRGPYFKSAKYYTSFKGDYLFHTIITASPNGAYIPSTGYLLGQRASHGCIRLAVSDAKWIYEKMPTGTPVRITN